jgi:oligosaccharide 4-alpha-D-glucosyltransferase
LALAFSFLVVWGRILFMRKFCLLICFLWSFFSLSAQADFITSKSFATAGGEFTVAHFDRNIYKIKFEPVGYKNGEQVSDAVILKRPLMMGSPFEVKVKGDTVFLRDKAVLIGVHQNNGNSGFYFPLQQNEMIFGAGERALPLNRRGYRLNLYNNPWYGYSEGADNLNYSVPFITSSAGYGLFFDNPSKGYLDIGKTNKDVLEYGASSGELNVYVIFGNYQEILQSYHKLTGTQPLPPRWAFGNLMSRFGYTSEAQVRDILGKMKAENIPVDAVIFDLFWFGDSVKHTMGNLDWVNKTKWQDPKKMIGDFKKEGINTLLVTEPFFVETSKNYAASKKYLAVDSSNQPYYLSDFYFGKGGLVDIFRKDAQQWFWQFYKKQMENGVEAWWGDLGEPEKHPSNLYHNLKDYGFNRLFKADEVHNLYGHTWTKMLYDFYAKEYPNKRLFSLNRSGFAGSQRYSIFPWTGDVSRSWSGLGAQLPVLLGMSMSGVPYVHSDAGGFAGGEGDNELYVRWLQFAAFTPIFRPHGTALYEVEPAAFSFPSEVALIEKPYREYAKLAIKLRYTFMPYNYSLAYQQTKYGKPLIAPLYYYFPKDTAAVKIQDEYMWGENILVAPVLEKGMKERKVYLPKGKWQDMSNKTIDGGSWVTVPLHMEFIPMFVREGSFIPLMSSKTPGTDLPNASNNNSASAFLVFLPSSTPSTFEWFEDDGMAKNSISTGNYTKVVCSGKEEKTKVALSISPSNDLYLKKNITVSVTGFTAVPRAVMVNGKTLVVKTLVTNQWNLNSALFNKNIAAWNKESRSVEITTKLKGVKKIQIEIIK